MITHAQLTFDETGVPVSTKFDDIYFSKHDGIAETQYVFLKHNGLPERFQTSSVPFHIVETGFGTGLNFLVAWHNLNISNQENGTTKRLKFTTFEKFPLSKSDLIKALAMWPQFKEQADALINAYPETLQSQNELTFENGLVTLVLLIGDVNEIMPTLSWPEVEAADAWFLDGFAPSKNPDMWTDGLFQNMFRLSKPDCTVATFTAAGLVRRGLLNAGFNVCKYKGFGHKREMVASCQLT